MPAVKKTQVLKQDSRKLSTEKKEPAGRVSTERSQLQHNHASPAKTAVKKLACLSLQSGRCTPTLSGAVKKTERQPGQPLKKPAPPKKKVGAVRKLSGEYEPKPFEKVFGDQALARWMAVYCPKRCGCKLRTDNNLVWCSGVKCDWYEDYRTFIGGK